MKNFAEIIAKELQLSAKQTQATIELLEEGATVPFISRYRKEMTGSLDEVQVMAIRDRLSQIKELEKRREFIIKTIDEQEKLTPELSKKIEKATSLNQLEDIYLPYKPKRRTKATIAREKGLEPLALLLLDGKTNDIEKSALAFVDEKKEVKDIEEALKGARHIIAEIINEEPTTRAKVRRLFEKQGQFKSKVMIGKEEEGKKYKDYFDWNESLIKAPSHRVLAMRRGEKEQFLTLDISPEQDDALDLLETQYINNNTTAPELKKAVKDAYRRLLKPSMETEMRMLTKKKADESAISVFADNLRQLLLSAPLGQKAVLALDPGFRTGCKVVCLDKQGKLLDNTTIYPNEPQKKTTASATIIKNLVEKYKIEAIAVGNGTASRETEAFANDLQLQGVDIIMVNESGASIYSASEVARNEFPDHDITVRGSVSIGRRLMDPLAELVKIDPKSIGVGQYQHDVDQLALKKSLDDVVGSCVNAVGVEVNTASKELLTYVAGFGPVLAENVVKYRDENGAFNSRKELLKVPRLGAKVYEQSAGFLRIRKGKNLLDASAVHPERYKLVETMAKDLNVTVKDLIGNQSLVNTIELKKYISEEVGMPTLQDIAKELAKPGRDPREQFESFSFTEGVEKITDLREGMKLPGIVTNITDFGAFVDIGVHQDGLVHLSQLANRFVKHPTEVVNVQQKVEVRVTEIDVARKRIGLSMKEEEESTSTPKKSIERKPKKKEKEASMNDQLAMLKAKFGR